MKPEIKISGVLALLDAGKSREEIAEHYGISMADCKRLFEHPSLKGKKAKKQPGFVLVDDTVDGPGEITNPDEEEDEIGGDFTDVNEESQEIQEDIAAEAASVQAEETTSDWDN